MSANEQWLKCNLGKIKTTIMVGIIRLWIFLPFCFSVKVGVLHFLLFDQEQLKQEKRDIEISYFDFYNLLNKSFKGSLTGQERMHTPLLDMGHSHITNSSQWFVGGSHVPHFRTENLIARDPPVSPPRWWWMEKTLQQVLLMSKDTSDTIGYVDQVRKKL